MRRAKQLSDSLSLLDSATIHISEERCGRILSDTCGTYHAVDGSMAIEEDRWMQIDPDNKEGFDRRICRCASDD